MWETLVLKDDSGVLENSTMGKAFASNQMGLPDEQHVKAGVVYSGEYDVCVVTLSVYPHRTSLKNMPGHGGNRTYDLWNTSPMLCQLSYANRPDRVAQLAEHWASIPKVVGSIPTVAGHIFQARPVWIYTPSNNTNIIFT